MFELIHTSAPRGLFGGSGYTTVAATTGIPEALRKALESLSGYEQVFDYGSPQFSANPVAFICQPIGQAAGKSWWVLSRIAVAEKDYTGRSNYLAHHLALEHHELPQAGPVALAKAFPWQAAWAGEPRALSPRTLPGIPAFPAPAAAPAWARAGLDAGWAGHLAEQARSRRGTIQLVYPAGVDPLALVADAVALLPPMERWDARFHTHTSRPRPEQAWAWFPVEGSGTTDLSRRPGVIHLGLRPACPGTGSLVDQARGKMPSLPVPGGPGLEAFPGINAGRSAMPVATATEAAAGYHAPAGSWNHPPVPPKAKVLGPLLHWVAHALLLVAVGVLAWFVVDDTARLSSSHKMTQEKDGDLAAARKALADKEKDLEKLAEFKNSTMEVNKIDAAELAKVGEKKTLINPDIARELAQRLDAMSKDKPGKEIGREQFLSAEFKIEEPKYLISGEVVGNIRGQVVDLKEKEKKLERLVPLEDVLSGKSDLGGKDVFNRADMEGDEFIAEMAKSAYGKDKEAMRAFRGLAAGVPTRESFNGDRLYDFVFRKNDFERKLKWVEVFDKAEEYSRWPDTVKKSPVVALYAVAVVYPKFGKGKNAEDPYKAHCDQARDFLDKNSKAGEFIRRKLMEVARP